MGEKILIIAYYWPPGGGIAVRRWMGLANAFAASGVQVHVLTIHPDSAAYQQVDQKLVDDIDDRIVVHTVRAFNPFAPIRKWAPRAIPGAAFSERKSSSMLGRILTVLRSHLFIPDPRKTWVRKAIGQGSDLVDEYGIETIITTSPPQSVQLIGRGIKRARPNVHWMADFRDPWTDIFYYERLGHSTFSRRIDARLERKVLEAADTVLTVSWGFRDLLASKVGLAHQEKFHVLTNGMDFQPTFVDSNPNTDDDQPFRLVYTGTMAPSYAPESVLDSILQLNASGQHREIQMDYFGGISSEYQHELQGRYPFISFHGFVTQSEVVKVQKAADLLFLIGPNVAKSQGHIPGKLFEYLGAFRPIAFLGHPGDDATRILHETGAGICLPRDNSEEIIKGLVSALTTTTNGQSGTEQLQRIQPYIRSNQAQIVLDLIRKVSSPAG